MKEPRFDALKNLSIPREWTERALKIPETPKKRRRYPFALSACAAALLALAVGLWAVYGWRAEPSLPVRESSAPASSAHGEVTAPMTEITTAEAAFESTSAVVQNVVEPTEATAFSAEPTEATAASAERTEPVTEPATEQLTDVCAFTSDATAAPPTGETRPRETAAPHAFTGTLSLTYVVDSDKHDRNEAVCCVISDRDGGVVCELPAVLTSLSPDLPDAVCVMRCTCAPYAAGVTVEPGEYRVVFRYEDGEALSDNIMLLNGSTATRLKERW